MTLFWQTLESFPAYVLQQSLVDFHKKATVQGELPVFVDIGDVSIGPDDDYIDLFISLIFATSNDGIERIFNLRQSVNSQYRIRKWINA